MLHHKEELLLLSNLNKHYLLKEGYLIFQIAFSFNQELKTLGTNDETINIKNTFEKAFEEYQQNNIANSNDIDYDDDNEIYGNTNSCQISQNNNGQSQRQGMGQGRTGNTIDEGLAKGQDNKVISDNIDYSNYGLTNEDVKIINDDFSKKSNNKVGFLMKE